MDVILEASGLSKAYPTKRVYTENRKVFSARGGGTVTALEGADLRLRSGRVYALVGHNGAGKTTLLRLIAGLARPTGGTLSLFGSETEEELFRAQQRVGYLISQPGGYEDMSMWQNLRHRAMLLPAGQRPDLRALCDRVGLNYEIRFRSLRKAPVLHKLRYSLAAALLNDPDLLLLDEPTHGLNAEGIEELRQRLPDLRGDGDRTMVITGLPTGELHGIATDYVYLKGGRVLEAITAAELDRRIDVYKKKTPEGYFQMVEQEEPLPGILRRV